MAKPRDDMELMQHFDGELGEPAGQLSPELDDAQRAKLESLEQVSEVVRSHLELAADDVDERLDAMWGAIERRIGANGQLEAARAAPIAPDTPRADDAGLFTRLGRWLDAHRGHVLTGAVCAGAAAALVLLLREPDTVIHERIVQVPAPAPEQNPAPAYVKSEPAVVENLDVEDGSGTILTIPGDEGENPTTVIWVTGDDMEGPI